jgi:hypothetical protein
MLPVLNKNSKPGFCISQVNLSGPKCSRTISLYLAETEKKKKSVVSMYQSSYCIAE